MSVRTFSDVMFPFPNRGKLNRWRKREWDRWTRRGRWMEEEDTPRDDKRNIKGKETPNWSNSRSGHSAEAEQLFSRWYSAQFSIALWGLVSALSSHKFWQITSNCKVAEQQHLSGNAGNVKYNGSHPDWSDSVFRNSMNRLRQTPVIDKIRTAALCFNPALLCQHRLRDRREDLAFPYH